MASATTPASAEAMSVTIRIPSKYADPKLSGSGIGSLVASPPLSFLHRTWSVTHSTLSMWRTARNVRITYKPLDPSPKNGAHRVDDLVEYEDLHGKGGVKTVAGVDTASSSPQQQNPETLSWDWRGKGMLFFVSSHWEVLGWGEAPLGDGAVERWAVTWFAPTLFTSEGLDIYCDRDEGLSPGTADAVLGALKGIGVPKLAELVKKDMRPVEISLPWKTK